MSGTIRFGAFNCLSRTQEAKNPFSEVCNKLDFTHLINDPTDNPLEPRVAHGDKPRHARPRETADRVCLPTKSLFSEFYSSSSACRRLCFVYDSTDLHLANVAEQSQMETGRQTPADRYLTEHRRMGSDSGIDLQPTYSEIINHLLNRWKF